MYVVLLLVCVFQEKEVDETGDSETQPTIDFKSLKSLSDIGIDMSFLEDYGKYEHIFVFKDINSVNSNYGVREIYIHVHISVTFQIT